MVYVRLSYDPYWCAKLVKWSDTEDIACMLEDLHADKDIFALRFTELRDLVLALPGFDDSDDKCNEGILEAIQMQWADERGIS